MVQMDGSFHRWLEGRGPEGCLMDLVDDATNTTLARLGEEETNLGGGGGVAGLDRALRGAGGLIRGLEESVQAVCHGAGGAERGRADHAVWAHVREAGDRVDRGQFAAGQGAGGADSRDASGPAG